LEDRAGNIWMTSDYGKDVGDTLGGAWCYRPTADTNEKSFTKITNKAISFILQDKDSNIWLGTRGTGLYRYDGKTLVNFTE
jgi:ligand-binding sensor domain-containing protein